jgi:hypothetical protein
MIKIIDQSVSGLGENYMLSVKKHELGLACDIYDYSDKYLGYFIKSNNDQLRNSVSYDLKFFKIAEYLAKNEFLTLNDRIVLNKRGNI